MKRIVITGATSMLGLALIKECMESGTEVVAIIRPNSPKKNALPSSASISIIECEVSQLKSLNLDLSLKYDAFYHFAWEYTDNSSRNIVDAQAKNIDNTLAALKLASRFNCQKFIGAGSQAEYGRVSGAISTTLSVSPDTAYGIAKYSAGRLSSILSEQLGIPFIWTRIFSTYGINDMNTTMIMYCIDKLLKGESPSLTGCEQLWDYLYCEDAAKAFYLIGEKGKDKSIYNIGSGKVKPLSEYVYAIRNAIDANLPLGIGEKDYATKQVMHLCADISDLIDDTGFKPSVEFNEGIRKTIAWYKTSMHV